MLFKQIRLNNFLVFKGDNKIDFPGLENNESSMILILAANNSGKTNIIKALRFLFYGDLLGHETEMHKLINETARGEGQTKLECWVEATIIDKNKYITIRRKLNVLRVSSGYKVTGVSLEKIEHNPSGDKYYNDSGSVQRDLKWKVPEALFDYFYFKGEELAENLMEGSKNRGIADGLLTLLHINDWHRALKNTATAQSSIIQELKKFAEANREHQNIMERYEIFEAKESDYKNRLIKANKEKDRVDKEFDEITNELLEMSKGSSSQASTTRLQRCQFEWRDITKEIDNFDSQICKTIGDSKGVMFLSHAYETAGVVLKKMQDDNLLPADISVGFVDRLIKKQLCICGRALHPMDNKTECECVNDYKKRSLSTELNAGLLAVLNNIDRKSSYGYPNKALISIDNLSRLLNRRSKSVLRQYEITQEIEILQKELANPILGLIAKLVQKQKTLSGEKIKIREQIVELERDLRMASIKKKECQNELDRFTKQYDIKKIKELSEAVKIADIIKQLIETSLRYLRESFHHIMQSSVEEYYNNIVTDGTKAHIDKESLLPSIISKTGEIRKNIGGGQRQLLVLAHIISLCQLRKELHRQLTEIGIVVGKLDDQSFFFDSIFAPTDLVYAKNIINMMSGKARQVVLLLASQQWSEPIRAAVEPRVEKTYKFLLHTSNVAIKEEEYTVKYRKKDIELIKKCNNGKKYEYSKIMEVS